MAMWVRLCVCMSIHKYTDTYIFMHAGMHTYIHRYIGIGISVDIDPPLSLSLSARQLNSDI